MDASAEGKSDYFFSMGYRIESLRGAVESFFAVNSAVKSAAILCWDDAWGRAHVKLWREIAHRHGVSIVDEVCESDFGNDYRTAVTRIVAKKPDAVIISFYADRVMQRMKEQSFNPRILTTSDMVEALSVRKAEPIVVEGAYFTYWTPSEDFVRAFRAKFNRDPILEAHNHYEALRSLARGIEANPESPNLGLKQVKYDGVAGPIDFSQAPYPNLGVAKLYRTENGGWREVEQSR
jgi:ABC-type branched-subunit amino acid transport system substrate-binding protein